MTGKTFELSPGYTISRVIRGGWQLAGGHGAIDRQQAVADLIATFDAGIGPMIAPISIPALRN